MYYNPHALKVYTDGSALKNPGGPGGIAGIVDYPDNSGLSWKSIFCEGYRNTTNNRMELRASIRGLDYLRREGIKFSGCQRILLVDSSYIYENYLHAFRWKRNKWMNRHFRPVENQDLWNELLSGLLKSKATIRLVEGKSDEITKEVDRLAKKSAKSPTKIDFGYLWGRITPKKGVERTARLFPAKNQTIIIRIYRHSYKKAGNLNLRKVYFELYSDLENYYYGNYFAYLPHEKEIHSRRRYEVVFNNNPNLPTIVENFEVKEK